MPRGGHTRGAGVPGQGARDDPAGGGKWQLGG